MKFITLVILTSFQFTNAFAQFDFQNSDQIISFKQVCSTADATVTYLNQLNSDQLFATFETINSLGNKTFSKLEVTDFVAKMNSAKELERVSVDNCDQTPFATGIQKTSVHSFTSVTFSSLAGTAFPKGLVGLDQNGDLNVKYLCKSELETEISCD